MVIPTLTIKEALGFELLDIIAAVGSGKGFDRNRLLKFQEKLNSNKCERRGE